MFQKKIYLYKSSLYDIKLLEYHVNICYYIDIESMMNLRLNGCQRESASVFI